jgi:hypothetical protein
MKGAVVCHCKNCQKQSGSAFSINILVKSSDFELTGGTRVFHDRGDSGGAVDRHFCADCGSPVITVLPSRLGIVILKAGTLDDSSTIPQPMVQSYCDSAQHWVDLQNIGKKFGKMPF